MVEDNNQERLYGNTEFSLFKVTATYIETTCLASESEPIFLHYPPRVDMIKVEADDFACKPCEISQYKAFVPGRVLFCAAPRQ